MSAQHNDDRTSCEAREEARTPTSASHVISSRLTASSRLVMCCQAGCATRMAQQVALHRFVGRSILYGESWRLYSRFLGSKRFGPLAKLRIAQSYAPQSRQASQHRTLATRACTSASTSASSLRWDGRLHSPPAESRKTALQ